MTSFATVDTNTAPGASESRVRLLNLSPTAGAIDVFLTPADADLATATPAATGLAYQETSGYLTLPPATYQVRAVPAGTPPADRAANVVINRCTSTGCATS